MQSDGVGKSRRSMRTSCAKVVTQRPGKSSGIGVIAREQSKDFSVEQ